MMGLFDFQLDRNPEKNAQMRRGLLDWGMQMLAQGGAPTSQAIANAGLLSAQMGERRAAQAQQDEMRRMQMDEYRARVADRQRAAQAQEDASRRQEAFRADLQGTTDYAALAQRYPDQIEQLGRMRDFQSPQVSRVEETEIDGRKVRVLLDKFGNRIGNPMPAYVDPVKVDQGNRVSFVRPEAGMSLPIGMSPSERDASARGWASNRIAQQRLAMDQQQASAESGSRGLKPPAGYRFKPDGSLEAIPGGPADIKAGELGAKADARREGAMAGAQGVLNTIRDARELVGYTTSGFGGMAAVVPASDARNLRAKLDTIKANIGFDRLQQMREASPTGGALGQVAVQELNSLQATVASLDQMQSPSQLKGALDKIERHYSRWMETMQQQGGGAGGSWDAPAPSRSARTVSFGSLR